MGLYLEVPIINEIYSKKKKKKKRKKFGLGNFTENCTRDNLRRHCDHDTTWERKPKRNLKGRGFKSKCLPIFVCYYYELLSSVPWCYILQALSPLVYYFYYTVMIEKGWSKILRSKKK